MQRVGLLREVEAILQHFTGGEGRRPCKWMFQSLKRISCMLFKNEWQIAAKNSEVLECTSNICSILFDWIYNVAHIIKLCLICDYWLLYRYQNSSHQIRKCKSIAFLKPSLLTLTSQISDTVCNFWYAFSYAKPRHPERICRLFAWKL